MGERRGWSPRDEHDFRPGAQELLHTASFEFGFLLDRGYPRESACTFVGNRYQLTERQRLVLLRSTCGSLKAKERLAKLHLLGDTAYEDVCLDGFNVLIPLEAALSGAPIILAEDGSIRDLAGISGTWHPLPCTYQALDLLLAPLGDAHPRSITVFLDAPVSNSGRLAALFREEAQKFCSCSVTVELVRSCDRMLAGKSFVASNDSHVIDAACSWLSIDREAMAGLDDVWLLDFSEHEKGSIPL